MTSSSSAVPAGMESYIVGLIGMGDMGKMYADRLSAAGWRAHLARVLLGDVWGPFRLPDSAPGSH
ncbi:Prephenate dehydrogenase [NADP(+)] [Tolypocladium capitatum]|uniref:Prephenate dehydrogenase [NADP(+)] n=1 Tax=Tolypocladium capitatum TaxID=45235 RepID=A0A2K3QGV3_9HYPO|nr:Prephenate dehydrogenase [NADP(+)] [Tolypocladium capitatum]